MIPSHIQGLIRSEANRNRVRCEQPEDACETLREWMYQSMQTHVAGGELERGRQLLEGSAQLGPFGSVDVGTNPDWTVNPIEDRNWLWRWHQWEFTRDYLKLWTIEGDEGALRQLLGWVNGWLDAHLWGDSNLTMAWHDHATALRLRNLFHIWAVLSENGDADAEMILTIEDAIAAHCAILSVDQLYTEKTNHGFDQMYILLSVSICCCIFEESAGWAKIANARLQEEIKFAFTSDGVHVENSPAYHQYMLLRLIRSTVMFKALGIESEVPFDEIIGLGLDFLSWIVRPDGTLPLIGDTVQTTISPLIDASISDAGKSSLIQFVESRGAGCSTGINHRVFTDSGWAVIRHPGTDGAAFEESLHLVLKSGFKSIYHRQDDDTHLVLNAFGSEWLIDGGMYNYQENDPKRIFLRSSLSHNLVVLPSIPIHRNPILGRDTSSVSDLSEDGVVRIRAVTEMYDGFRIQRSIEQMRETEFIIQDQIEITNGNSQIPPGSHVRFHFPGHLNVVIEDSHSAMITREDGCRMSLRALQGIESITHHVGTVDGVIQSWRSIHYGIGEDTQVLCFHLVDSDNMSRIQLSFEEV